MDLEQAYATRSTVLERLREDLLGGAEETELSEPPLSRFVVGVLYPKDQDDSASVEETQQGDAPPVEGVDRGDGAVDPGVALSHVRFPRSLGLTFAVDDQTSEVSIGLSGHRYVPQQNGSWTRTALEAPPFVLPCAVTDAGVKSFPEDDLQLRWIVRKPRNGVRSVTVSLVNDAEAPRGERDAFCWFDPRIEVSAPEGALRPRPEGRHASVDEDEVASQRLLFRNVENYAVGHGCAVEWNAQVPVTTLCTTFLPTHELLLSDAAGEEALHSLHLGMRGLAEARDWSTLHSLVDAYENWLSDLPAGISLGDADAATLDRHLNDARSAAARMRRGIEILERDPLVERSFRLMNLAMEQQRERQDFHRSGNIGNPTSSGSAGWRPFQIAFVLLNLEGLTDPGSDDRALADLLWFPTGGGKTEAYLGLIGITILLRRLRDPNAAGVSVLMRYTLRLLTLQQYERAAGLICALEDQRQRDVELERTAPISIGLWVGQASTPNSVQDARRALKRLRDQGPEGLGDDESNPVQLRQCPWCGASLDDRNYTIVDGTRMRVACGEESCRYRDGLPVHIVDDDVYNERPSLIIATVDKFAMLAWKAEPGRLLGTQRDPQGRRLFLPPDLIVQDELHLISGPLGTVVGLYETAIDALCTVESPPKVIASTATIRRATDQVRAVFAREARQFPPQAAEADNSFFAVAAPRTQKGTRAYAGVMAPGTSHAMLLIRVYASLLQSAGAIDSDDPGADLYWTLLGYFNSLRVLGGAYIQVLDDVPDQMKVIAERRGEQQRPLSHEPREMTSRRKSGEIPEELERLAKPRGDEDAADVVLATNMISVGVDVDRLGLMVMMGQPQTSSEYIQATSRVGRRAPGLVVTLYNSARSRDLSHYEDFTSFHSMVYRHVEATGATPFAPRARDRALHGVLVAMARHLLPGAHPENAAGAVPDREEELSAIVETIVARAAATRDPHAHCPEDERPEAIREELEDLLEQWEDGQVDHYAGWFGRRVGALMVDAGERVTTRNSEPPAEHHGNLTPWPTLTSMRDVDAESGLYLAERRSSRGR